MAYKRISPLPLVEGGTNAQSFATQDGVSYYDGTRLVVTGAGNATQILTSNGAGMAPTFQNASSSTGSSFVGTGGPNGWIYDNTNLPAGRYWHAAYYPYSYDGFPVSLQNSNQTVMPLAGTFSNLYVLIFSNGSSADVTITLNKNSVNTALTINIPATTTGTFSDTVNSVAFAAGDLFQWEVQNTVNGDIRGVISMKFVG